MICGQLCLEINFVILFQYVWYSTHDAYNYNQDSELAPSDRRLRPKSRKDKFSFTEQASALLDNY